LYRWRPVAAAPPAISRTSRSPCLRNGSPQDADALIALDSVAAIDPEGIMQIGNWLAHGGVYVAVALAWLWLVDGIRPGLWDVVGAAVTLAGMAIIAFAPRSAG